ncbi:hypothetical protein F5141DRAFT_1231302 [Pisolithus sp. B1]|nr:hypothetical protein F5141DRAFT_1231302 [Pisolithus sp. B1]
MPLSESRSLLNHRHRFTCSSESTALTSSSVASRNPPLLSQPTSMRDAAFKTINDPLTAITQQLAARSSSSNDTRSALPNSRSKNKRFPHNPDRPPPPPPQPKQLDPASERLRHESSERERALALIRKKKQEMAGSETPSTVHGGMDNGYGDVFNRREAEEAHAQRDRWKKRHW